MTTRNTGLDAVTDVLDACGYSGRVVGAAEAHALTAPGPALFCSRAPMPPTTAKEGGILRAGGLVGGRFAHTIKRIMDESPTYASGSVHANASMH
jgi:hypothetical protein